jgi:Zn-dependent peptidase ImmA (M78 family)/transcriptional regulator with XRE-family HTH domain
VDLVERVRRVINRSDSTNAEFAERIGIDPTKLSKSLNGARRFTSFELAAIAAEARTTVDWLLTGEEPERALIAARHSAREIDDTLQAAEGRVRELADVASALDKLVDRPSLAALPEAVSTGRPLDDAAAMADGFLAILRKTDSSVAFRTDPAATVEGLFDIGVACEQFARGFDGLALNSSRYRFIIVNTSNAWSRQRFTLAHEIGHIVAGDGSHSGLCVDQDVMATGQTVQEKRANAFAACVLMPHDELHGAVDTESGLDERGFGRLVGRFCVSPSALAWRLKNLDLVNDDERARLGSMPMKKAAERGGWSARLAELTMDQSRTRHPAKLAARTVKAFATGAVSARLVATVLNTEPEAVLAAWDQVTEAAPTATDSREVVFQP